MTEVIQAQVRLTGAVPGRMFLEEEDDSRTIRFEADTPGQLVTLTRIFACEVERLAENVRIWAQNPTSISTKATS